MLCDGFFLSLKKLPTKIVFFVIYKGEGLNDTKINKFIFFDQIALKNSQLISGGKSFRKSVRFHIKISQLISGGKKNSPIP